FPNVNGTTFSGASEAAHGFELWKTNGTAAGTQLVLDLNPGVASANIQSLMNINGTLFFAASDGTTAGRHGRELWRSNGTAAGTVLVRDINPGGGDSSPTLLTNANGVLFFAATDGVRPIQLWKSNGTAAA